MVHADNYDALSHKLVRPVILFYAHGVPVAVEWAPEGTWQGNGANWTLLNGHIQQLSADPLADIRSMGFKEQTTRVGVDISQLLLANQDPYALTFAQLRARAEWKKRQHRPVEDVDTDLVMLYSKIAIPFASLIFALVGFPLGIRRQRSGGAIGFALSIAIIFVYYLIYQYTSIWGDHGVISPMICAWLPDVLGIIVAIGLLRRASR
jgi:lipopolysaccharide export system permease protein